MKTIFFALVILSVTRILAADSYDSVFAAATEAKTVQEKLELYAKAAELGSDDAQKIKALKAGFDLSVQSSDKPNIALFGNLLAECKNLKDSERAEIKYKAIEAVWTWKPGLVPAWRAGDLNGPSPKLWEDFLSMPGITPEQEISALLNVCNAYRNINMIDKAIAAYEKVINHPSSGIDQKSDAMIALSECLVLIFQEKKAIEYLNRLLAMKEIPGFKKARIYMLLGDTIINGSGYYFEASEKDYIDAYDAYKKAAELKNAPKEIQESAVKKIADSYFDRKMYKEANDAYEEIINSKKNPPSGGQWNSCMQKLGQAKIQLKDYEGAISCFDKTRAANSRSALGDVYRSLGQAYYKNKDYVLALGAYSEALNILEKQERVEDDRPKWCKSWINKIKWFTANAPQLDAAMKKRAQKLEAEAKAHGKAPVKSKVSEFKSASDGAKNPEAKKTNKKVNIDKLDIDTSSDLLENGLQ